jgi:Na+/phosphate symporter
MSTRWTLKAWVALSALALFLLFATVAAQGMLQGTRPPAALVRAQAGAALCEADNHCGAEASARRRTSASAARSCPEATRLTTI